MDEESKIAEALKAKLAQLEPVIEEKPKEEPKTDERFVHDLPPENLLERQRWLDYFNVPSMSRREPQIDGWLTRVIDWARDEAGSSEYADMLRVIDDQERILGSKIKQDRLSTLARFAQIRVQRRKLLAEERAIYG